MAWMALLVTVEPTAVLPSTMMSAVDHGEHDIPDGKACVVKNEARARAAWSDPTPGFAKKNKAADSSLICRSQTILSESGQVDHAIVALWLLPARPAPIPVPALSP
jgi:hypothetical protein